MYISIRTNITKVPAVVWKIQTVWNAMFPTNKFYLVVGDSGEGTSVTTSSLVMLCCWIWRCEQQLSLLLWQLEGTHFLTCSMCLKVNLKNRTHEWPTVSKFFIHQLMHKWVVLTLCRPDGLLIKYPQFPDLLNALNVQPHNIFLLMVWHCRLRSWAPDYRNCMQIV